MHQEEKTKEHQTPFLKILGFWTKEKGTLGNFDVTGRLKVTAWLLIATFTS